MIDSPARLALSPCEHHPTRTCFEPWQGYCRSRVSGRVQKEDEGEREENGVESLRVCVAVMVLDNNKVEETGV